MIKRFNTRLFALFFALLTVSCTLAACKNLGGDIVLTDPISDPVSTEESVFESTAEDVTSEEKTAPPETAKDTTEEATTEVITTEEATTEEITTEEITTEEVTTEPPVTETPWNLVLVNPWHPLSEEYEFELTAVRGNSYFVDSRCADAVKQMLADCKAAGFTPYICSAFRKWEDQVSLFEKKVASFANKGYSDAEARVLAAKEVAIPGTSEHQLGLAVDILDTNRPWLDDGQADMPTQKWLMANCHKYGFILRYPKGTTDITGIIYEPWHYRYVGVEIATEIMTKGITLEEYLGLVASPEDTKVPPTSPEEPETTTAPETTVAPETTYAPVLSAPMPEKTEPAWNLILINKYNSVPSGFSVELAEIERGHKVDARIVDALKRMLADCKAAGHTPYVCDGYRTYADQTSLFNKRVEKYKSMGYSESRARELASNEVAFPGTSEHQIGLAVDILCTSQTWASEAQANTATQQWLMANCHKYGFILRYPDGATSVTGIVYEPWHYRYVGVEAATEIAERGITLEEYLGKVGAN